MKTNILSIKTIVKKYMKYLCALLLLLIGTNARVWGTTGIYIEYNKSTYYDGSTITINLDYAGSDLVDVTELIFKNNEGWTSTGGVSYGYIMCEISGSYVPSNILFDSFSSGNSWNPILV